MRKKLGGKAQASKRYQKMTERTAMKNSSFERFGKYLLSKLNIDTSDVDFPELIKDYIRYYRQETVKSTPGMMYINWVCATEFGQDPHTVRTIGTRHRKYIYPKHSAMYLAVVLFKYEYEPLLEFYNMKNHATVVSALDNVRDLMYSDKKFNEKIEAITDKLLGYGTNNENANKRSDTTGSFGSIQDPEIKERDSVLVDGNREIESSD